jgi:LmbE family N-acetylglucosaminyl deacetylase
MTAKEKLRERIEALSEDEAADALRLLDMRSDPMLTAFLDAPEDDEPLTPEEEAAIKQSREEYDRGEAVSLDEIRHEFS